MFTEIRSNNRGSLLLEILVVIGILAVIVSFGSQFFLSSARSNQSTRMKNAAVGLAEETFEAVRGISTENWVTMYQPPNGTGDPVTAKGAGNHYRITATGTKWIIESGEETVNLDGINFTRYFTIDNISRDAVGRNIEAVYNSANDDPSTQKITVVVSWAGDEPLTMTQFLTRWRNKVCDQTNWSGGVVSGTTTCATTGYGAIDTNIDVGTAGSIKLKSQ